MMPASESDDLASLLLQPFDLADRTIVIRALAGSGRASYVVKVRIGKKEYALKMYKFDHPELNVTRYKGTKRKFFYDPFFIECRAHGVLVQQGLNGHITAFCYGWIDVPGHVEVAVGKHFEIHPYQWNRPHGCNQNIRGILFEWIDGQSLTNITISSTVAEQARTKLRALHKAGVVHGDLAATNFLVQMQPPGEKVYLIDLSASVASPHIKFSLHELQQMQRHEMLLLELGFQLLSRLPINQGLCFADFSTAAPESLRKVLADSRHMEHLWAPPKPTCWQSAVRETGLVA